MYQKCWFKLILVVLLMGLWSCQNSDHQNGVLAEKPVLETIYETGSYWADSVYHNLSKEERIAQLFWVAIENPGNTAAFRKQLKLVSEHQPGGILLFRMAPETAIEVIDTLHKVSRIPLLVSVDGEWGPAMRFPGVNPFPYAMTLGAIRDDSLIYLMGLEMARQFRLMGIHINMAPVADVNSNPNNPVIGFRSFGEMPKNVARKSVAKMQGLQDGNVMAVGKHFPGHGDTETDSHKTLPLVEHPIDRLDSMELLPFRTLIDSGIWAVMTAHIEVPVLEPTPGMPVSFSKPVIKGLLRDSMNFNGLVITDAVNMQGAKTMGPPGKVDALALAAGNDIVEFTEDLPAAIEAVMNAINEGWLTWSDIEEKCRRSLAFKYWLTVRFPSEKVNADTVLSLINSAEADDINQKLYEAALTVLINKNGAMPENLNKTDRTAYIILGNAPGLAGKIYSTWQLPVVTLSTSSNAEFDRSMTKLADYDHLVLVIADTRWGRLAANHARKNQLMQLLQKKESLVVFMGNPYHLSAWPNFKNVSGLLVAYQNNQWAQNAVIRFLSGEIPATGQLPVSVEGMFEAGEGITF